MSNDGGGNTAQEAGVRKPQTAVDQRTAADRITVALIPQASDDLCQRLQDRLACQDGHRQPRDFLYEFIDSQLKAGRVP